MSTNLVHIPDPDQPVAIRERALCGAVIDEARLLHDFVRLEPCPECAAKQKWRQMIGRTKRTPDAT